MFDRQDSIDFDEGSRSSYGETPVEVIETITVPIETITIDDINAATIILSSDSSDSHSECAAPSKSNAMKKRRVEHSNKRKRDNSSSDEDILMERALAIMNETNDELDVFGQFVASEMRQISDLSARNFVKRKIMAILMNSGHDGMHEMQNHFQHITTGSTNYMTEEQIIFDPPCSI